MMDRNIVNNFLKRIKDTNKLEPLENEAKRFYRIYEGVLFKTVIPPINSYSGLYALTENGRNFLGENN